MNYDPDNSRRPYLRPLYDSAADADLKMPENNVLDQIATEVARKLAADQDALIRRCISRRIGFEWTDESIMLRLRWEIDRRKPEKMLLLDGKPLLLIWPPEHVNTLGGWDEPANISRMEWTIKYQEFK